MSSSGSYATCLADFSADASNASDASDAAAPTADALLRCVVAAANAWAGHPDAVRDAFFLLYAASLVFFMQMGFAMICADCVRVNKVQNTLLKSFLDTCGAVVHAFVLQDRRRADHLHRLRELLPLRLREQLLLALPVCLLRNLHSHRRSSDHLRGSPSPLVGRGGLSGQQRRTCAALTNNT